MIRDAVGAFGIDVRVLAPGAASDAGAAHARRLAAEGEPTFTELLQAARIELARRYLAAGRYSLTEIAEQAPDLLLESPEGKTTSLLAKIRPEKVVEAQKHTIDQNITTLRNRVLMGSMHTGLEDRASDYDKLAAYFAARARGGAGLIVTGGIAPSLRGWLAPFASKLSLPWEVARHRKVTKAVHDEGGKVCMQILHAGRYGYHPLSVAPSRLKSPITPFTPSALGSRGVERTIDSFVRCAAYAREAGYDGVEVMGSEGYLINQFLCARTNRRDDDWGARRRCRRSRRRRGGGHRRPGR